MAFAHSPLRYPGGKQVLTRVLAQLVKLNGVQGGTYAEAYAGGGGAALGLLFGEHVERVLINDADPRILAFWTAVLNHTERLLELLRTTRLSVREWVHQRAIYQQPRRYSTLRVGFATFYLNRCNRSGIIASGGPIGGKKQTGAWKIDARFNREELARRIEKIDAYRDRIFVSGLDAIDFLEQHVKPLAGRERVFTYLDPPYFAKGRDLYLNHYKADDHAALAAWLSSKATFPWALSYDNVREIRKLYAAFRQLSFGLDYSARERRVEREIMILKPDLIVPPSWKRRIPQRVVSAADRLAS